MENVDAIVTMLARSGLFGQLDAADRRLVAERMRRVQFEPRQLIFSRGDIGKEVYLVLEGRVRLSVLSNDGRELSLAHASQGDVFGEIAVLDGGERTAGATAITGVKAMVLTQRQLTEMVEANPRIGLAMVRFLCARLRDTDLKLESIALHSIEVRLARYFLDLLRSDAAGAARKAGDRATPVVHLGMSQGELALLVGASRPKVNLALTMLEEMGAITRAGTGYECDVDVLEGMASRD